MNEQIRPKESATCHKCESEAAPFGHYLYSREADEKKMVYSCGVCKDKMSIIADQRDTL